MGCCIEHFPIICTNFVLPTPQAIVIGLAVTALMLSVAMKLYQHYNTLNTNKMRLKG